MDFSFTIIGFLVGFIVGMTGVGGGSLMTPILVLGFGIQPAIAVGTDLLYAAISKSGGVFVHHKHGNIQWPIVVLLSIGSVPASICSIFVIKHLDASGINYDNLIMSTLSIALILTALFLLTRNQLHKFSQKEKFEALNNLQKADFIQKRFRHDTSLKTALRCLIIGLFTLEEYNIYLNLSPLLTMA